MRKMLFLVMTIMLSVLAMPALADPGEGHRDVLAQQTDAITHNAVETAERLAYRERFKRPVIVEARADFAHARAAIESRGGGSELRRSEEYNGL